MRRADYRWERVLDICMNPAISSAMPTTAATAPSGTSPEVVKKMLPTSTKVAMMSVMSAAFLLETPATDLCVIDLSFPLLEIFRSPSSEHIAEFREI